jgi:hypothetical protein
MKAQVYTVPDGIRLGTTSLKRTAEPNLGKHGWFRVGTSLGEPVLRSGRLDAFGARAAWDALARFVGDTGYHLKVETTQAEARALLAGYPHRVPSTVGTYRLVIRDNRVAVLTTDDVGQMIAATPCPRCNGYGEGHECQVQRWPE